MSNRHTFEAHLSWTKPDEASSNRKRIYGKTHLMQINGKQDLTISAAKAFKGDPALHNPEDQLLSSIMSCHMMSFLYVCSQHNMEVFSYKDKATAILETYEDGSGKIVSVSLFPQVIIADHNQIELANALHVKANKLCFIANSCNFPVQHEPYTSSIR